MNVWIIGFILVIVMALIKRFTEAPLNPKVKEEGEQFLEEAATKEGVYKLPSGMLFKILNKGTGTATPNLSTKCSCHYEGTLINGKVFDSSYKRGKPLDFAPNQVIPGWTEALQLMREGDKWQVTIPYLMAYGPSGAGADIPGYSTLVFTMELIKINGEGKNLSVSDKYFQDNFGKKYADL